MQKIFYDFEVFKHDWLVVFFNYETKELKVIINDKEDLLKYYENNKENIWIGYNNVHYDQWILKAILENMNPFEMSNSIIQEGINGNFTIKNQYQMYNFDLSNKLRSLKELEGFLGSKIKESDVDFTIDRKLTENEIKETLEYCKHDVLQTVRVFENSKEEFESQMLMIETFNMDMSNLDKSKAKLSAYILEAKKKTHNDDFELTFVDTLRLNKYKFVLDWYKNVENRNYNKRLFCDISKVPHVFAWGGIHGALSSYTGEGLFIMSDIASMYPSIMIEYDFISRNIKDKTKYIKIRDDRIELKKQKDKRQLPMKIILNGTYGAMKDVHNDLEDPLMANNVCINGQLLLLDLIEKIEPYCELIQSNTDGVLVKINSEKDRLKYMEECYKWSKRVRLDLEHDEYVKVIQKDVNNYIIVDSDGKYKSKGAYVKKLNKIDYDLPIINEAIVNYFTKNIPIENTIKNCDEFIKFQKIVKVSKKYKYAIHNNIKYKEKVFRVFASNNIKDGGIFKIKTEDRIEKIANTPEKCFIYNDDVIGLKCLNNLDKDYYIAITNDRLNKFLNSEIKEKKEKSGIKGINIDNLKDIQIVNRYKNFIKLCEYIKSETTIKKNQLDILIKLDYFKEFGKSKKLIQFIEYFNLIYNAKSPSKEKIPTEIYDIVEKHSEVTDKQFKINNNLVILEEIFNKLQNIDYTISEKISFQLEYLGYITYKNEDIPKEYVYIESIDTKYTPKIKIYCLNTGKSADVKIDKKFYNKNKVEKGDIICILSIKSEAKWIKDGDNFMQSTTEKEWKIHNYERKCL